jgi:hypothetical protein
MAGVLAVYSFELPFLIAAAMSLVGAWVVQRNVPETVFRQPRPPVEDLVGPDQV